MRKQQGEVLLVEDNPGDARLAKEALRAARLNSHLSVVADGEQALLFLRKQDGFSDAPRPDIILLDLNLPRKDGRELLKEIKADEDLSLIPVIVMSSSRSEEDVKESYRLHANCFITKPVDLASFLRVVKQVEEYWLSVARLPVTSE